MAEHSGDDLIASHVAAISARSRRETLSLADKLVRGAWPGGAADRTEPGALAWLRRWRPVGPTPLPIACGCSGGRCAVCN